MKDTHMSNFDKISISIKNMSCASCVGRVDRALSDVEGVHEVNVNLASQSARVLYSSLIVSSEDILAACKNSGYAAQVFKVNETRTSSNQKSLAIESYGAKALLSAIMALPIVVLEMGGHISPLLHDYINQTMGHRFSWIVQFLFTTLVLFGPGIGFFKSGLPALWRGIPDMNSLVVLGTSAAYLYSFVVTFFPNSLPYELRAVYYEPAAIIVVFILFGRFLEARARGKTGHAVEKLLGLRVKSVVAKRNGSETDINIDEVVVGDVLILHPGERVAVDGEVIEGRSYIDESMVSGEPMPVVKLKSDNLICGTVNGLGILSYRATKVGSDTTLSQIIALVDEAQNTRLPIQALVDKVTMWFIPAVIFVALATVITWLIFGPTPVVSYALIAGVSVLIVACPCAMGLATPTSIMVGSGRAAELGVLFGKGEAMQQLASLKMIAFDKTGTLTTGIPTLSSFKVANGFLRDDILPLVAGVEIRSEHPISGAIVSAARAENLKIVPIKDFIASPGLGVSGFYGHRHICVGSKRFLAEQGIKFEKNDKIGVSVQTTVYAAVDGVLAAKITVVDVLKPSAVKAVEALRTMGIDVAMITGDRHLAAVHVADQLGIKRVYADVLPADKVTALSQLKSQCEGIAFVGDGINDGPALAHADVGIAIGTGTDVAIESADVVLMSDDLMGIVNAFQISQKIIRNIKQNLFWAFGYNVALIPVAAGILYPSSGVVLSPMLAAAAMAASSLFVLSNALRLRFLTTTGAVF